MDQETRWRMCYGSPLAIMVFAFAVVFLVGCGAAPTAMPLSVPTLASTPQIAPPSSSAFTITQVISDSVIPTATALSTRAVPNSADVLPTRGPDHKSTALAEDDQRYSMTRTAVAVQHIPTRVIVIPTPGPTEPVRLGSLGCGASKNSSEPRFVSCWMEQWNGQLYGIYSGVEGSAGDPTQGVLMVSRVGTPSYTLYKTPQKLGSVRITSIIGTRVTLVPVNSRSASNPLIFDYVAGTWMNP